MYRHGVIEIVEASVRALLLLVLTSAFTGVALAAPGGIPGRPGGGGGGGGGSACFVKTASCDGITPAPGDFTPPAGWVKVFDENFDQTPANPDRSGTIDYKRWSTSYPFGSWRNNTAGDDDMWNVNTTGLEPGIGWNTDNIYSDMEKFMINLGYDESGNPPEFDVFSRSNNALVIQAHKNPWKHRINGRENFLGGMISSHSKPDTANLHGFEFTHGLISARVRVPERANGFRAALWLYSDNGFYNAVYGRPAVYEMDLLEYLPNTRGTDETGADCFVTQPDVFGISANTEILTYDTVFNTYHFPGGRTPYNWTFNSDATYDKERCALNGGTNSAIDYGSKDGGWAIYSLLWEEDFIEWYVNGVLVHRVDEITGGSTCSATLSNTDKKCSVAVYDSRMYFIASMHMGNKSFEGSVDTGAFTSDGGPEFAIDYIHVYQNPGNDTHTWCGNSGIDCSAR